jgi:hypothetical protein
MSKMFSLSATARKLIYLLLGAESIIMLSVELEDRNCSNGSD